MEVGSKIEAAAIHVTETPFGASLCGGCRAATIYVRDRTSEPHVFCRAVNGYVPGDIIKCNSFRPSGHPPLYLLREIAYDLPDQRWEVGIRPERKHGE